MLSFRQFIAEVWKRESDSYTDINGQEKILHPHDWVAHEKVGDTNVQIRAVKKPEHGGMHELMYMVNDQYGFDGRKPGADHAKKILHTVYKHVDRFIRHAKPEGVVFTSHLPPKQQLHSKLADHIAKRYNGHTETKDLGAWWQHVPGYENEDGTSTKLRDTAHIVRFKR